MGCRSGDSPYVVSVRELCRFAAKAGDLDRRFTPSPTAEEGQLGHRLAAARRGVDYRTEVRVEGSHRSLAVRGRADGFDEGAGHLEEFKTHRGDPGLIPANHQALHWAQAKVYGWLLCRALALPGLRISVVYLDVDTRAETPQTQSLDAPELRAFFESVCDRFIDWADAQRAHRVRRDAWLATLAWPFADFRAGQRTLAEAAYNAARSGRTLLAQAPTGIGKTLATLFPTLKAMPGGARPVDLAVR
jgi:DNA excision repair protein ERCC-2